MKEQKNILIWGDAPLTMEAMCRTIPCLTDDYVVKGKIQYGDLVTQDLIKNVDIMLYGLHRSYGSILRAEGIPMLAQRLRFGKKGLVYTFGLPSMADNPLIWDLTELVRLPEKLNFIYHISDFSSSLSELQDYFKKDIFPVDGHV